MPDDLFSFEWPVDQLGYEIEHVPAKEGWKEGAVTLLGASKAAHTEIRRRGGPLRYYRPMDNPGLWRRCADVCRSPEGALSFVNEFGLLGPPAAYADEGATARQRAESIVELANLLSAIGAALDEYQHPQAFRIFNAHARPRLTAHLVEGKKRFEFEIMPLALDSALVLQAGRAIAGGRPLRRCRNCPEWFEIGTGARTNRAAFCSDRCRVAWARKRSAHVASLSQ